MGKLGNKKIHPSQKLGIVISVLSLSSCFSLLLFAKELSWIKGSGLYSEKDLKTSWNWVSTSIWISVKKKKNSCGQPWQYIQGDSSLSGVTLGQVKNLQTVPDRCHHFKLGWWAVPGITNFLCSKENMLLLQKPSESPDLMWDTQGS